MKALQVTLLIVALSLLGLQFARHAYLKFFEDNSSVLDRFNKTDAEKTAEKAESLSDLMKAYEPVRKSYDELEAELDKKMKDVPPEDRWKFRQAYETDHKETYRRESTLSSAIDDWERKSREVSELRVFWAFGLVMFLVGLACYPKRPWLAMALLVPGVIEMQWWTSPTLTFGGTVPEYERLLNNKLLFTGLTIVLVMAAWLVKPFVDARRKSS